MESLHNVSLFPKLYQYAIVACDIEQIYSGVKSGQWAGPVNAVRAAYKAGNKKEAERLKGNLAGFTPSGTFEGGHRAGQLRSYNQLVGLDFDHVGDLSTLSAKFRTLPTTLVMFVSPSGQGLKVFVQVDSPVTRHAVAYRYVAEAYEQAGGVASDPKCKDISRCCYVSYDPDAWYNPDAEVFHVPDSPEAASLTPIADFARQYLERHPAIEGCRNQTVYTLGCEANRRGFAEADTAHVCRLLLQGEGFPEAEIKKALHSAYQGNTDEHNTSGTRCGHFTDTCGHSAVRDAQPLTGLSEEEGETLREQTPVFPQEVYDNLPPLLTEALEGYDSPRERDMALMAAIGVLSTCLPGMWGRYKDHDYHANLYVIDIAPAASGKGCIDDMRHLADRWDELLRIESERHEKEYLQALEEWELKKTEARRQHKVPDMADVPVKPTACHFLIPAQLSKAKLLIHLADNGKTGCLIVDSEIDTLVTAARQEYGLFDDILRKAYHHESAGSSKKGDNEFIRADHPCLSIVLGGTPAQFSRLIPNAENGLMSRLLLYTCRTSPVWQDVSPREGSPESRSQRIARLAGTVEQIASRLREHPLRFSFTRGQWAALNKRYKQLLEEAGQFCPEEFQSVVKRHGLMQFRIGMLFTGLTLGASEEALPGYCTCNDSHFRAAEAIATLCLEHSRLLMTQLRPADDHPELTLPFKFRDVFDRLPASFTSQEAYALGTAYGLNERTVRRFLKRISPLYIKRVNKGIFLKNTPPAA